jgi:DNA primase
MSVENKEHIELLTKLFVGFKNSLLASKSVAPREFLQQLGLDNYTIEVGYNSSQFHHRKSEEFKAQYINIGVLKLSDAPSNVQNQKTYTTVGKEGLVFPLKNRENKIVNYMGYRFKLSTPKIEHLNEKGVYPKYPNVNTKRLYLCQDEVDTATFIQSDILEKGETIVSLRNGQLTQDIKTAIEQIKNLDSIIIIGKPKADTLKELETNYPEQLRVVKLPEENLNEVWTKYGAESIIKILEIEATTSEVIQQDKSSSITNVKDNQTLCVISETEFQFEGEELSYLITGSIPTNATLLDMQFEIQSEHEGVLRTRLNLLDTNTVEATLFEWTDNTSINYAKAILELNTITKELQKLRKIQQQGDKLPVNGFSVKQDKLARELLNQKDLFKTLNNLIGQTGIIGEEQIRLLLYMIASSYKFKYNLHAVIQTDAKESGADFTNKIASLIPEIDRYELDLTSARTFRYYGHTINNKLLVIPEYKGITESKAIKDLKRLQSKGIIVNDTPKKGSNGLLYTTKQEVRGHTSSIGACGKSKRYFENEPRTILVGMDTTLEQEQKLMNYDCQLMAGLIDEEKENKAKELLQYVISNIVPLEVVNPFANELMLPIGIPNVRTLTMQLMNFVNIVTLFKQHQRKLDHKGRLITQKEDVKTAIDLFLDAIMVNIDELDATTRDFFDKLKNLYKRQGKEEKTAMSSLGIRQHLTLSKTTVNRLLRTLVEFEYVQK